MMHLFVALLLAVLAIVTVNGQGLSLMSGMGGAMPSSLTSGSGMGGSMALPLAQNQSQQLWQQFFFYRLMFGDSAARLIMADRLANMLGGGAFTRYYAGEFFDTPDAWWITSSLMNGNNLLSGANSGTTSPATGSGTASGGSI